MLIEGGTVVTLDDADTVLDEGVIAVRGHTIQFVGPPSAGADKPAPDRVLNASGMVVIPGLVNAHTHLFQTLLRGSFDHLTFREWLRSIYETHAVLDTTALEMSAALGAVESVRSGVTTVVDHQFLHRGVESSLAVLAGMREVGVRAILARTIMDVADLAPQSAVETAEQGLSAVDQLLSDVRTNGPAGIATVMTGANTPGISASAELAVAVRAFAEERGLRRSSHIAESAVVLDEVRRRTGFGVVEWLDHAGGLGRELLAAHAVHLTPKDIRLLAQSDSVVSHNPVSNTFLGDGVAPVSDLRAAGVPVALGTDGASSNHTQDMFQTVKAAALLQRLAHGHGDVLPAKAALRMATIDAARALGLQASLGSIEPGKVADLVILDLDGVASTVGGGDIFSRIVFGAGPANVHTVIINGEVVLHSRRFTQVDEPAVLAQAGERGRRLREALR